MRSPTVVVHEAPAVALAEHVRERAASALASRGVFSLALPGGSVATTGLPLLATSDIDWGRVELFWGDERAVPADHPDSNYGLARTLLLEHVSIPEANVHRMQADRADLARAAAYYEAVLRRVGLDLAVLGVGPDGHVCSLFPGHPLLDERVRWVAPIEDSPKPPPRRLTLTLPALLAATEIVVVATGAAKAEVVREATEDPASQLPLALVLRRAPSVLLILDAAAASLLRR